MSSVFNGATWAYLDRAGDGGWHGPVEHLLPSARDLYRGRQDGAVQYSAVGSGQGPAAIDKVGRLLAISCPTATFCMATDDHGYVTIGRTL